MCSMCTRTTVNSLVYRYRFLKHIDRGVSLLSGLIAYVQYLYWLCTNYSLLLVISLSMDSSKYSIHISKGDGYFSRGSESTDHTSIGVSLCSVEPVGVCDSHIDRGVSVLIPVYNCVLLYFQSPFFDPIHHMYTEQVIFKLYHKSTSQNNHVCSDIF